MADKQILDLTLENNPPRKTTFLEVQETTAGSKYVPLSKITGEEVVIVSDMSDFPAPSGGIITLAANTAYVIADSMTTSDRFVLSDRSNFFGYGGGISHITYTSAGNMFTGSNTTNVFNSVKMTASNAAGIIFDVDGSGGAGQRLELQNVFVDDCQRFCENTDVSINMVRCNITCEDSGIRYSGTLEPFCLIETSFIGASNASARCIDFGTSILSNIIIKTCTFSANATSGVCIAGAASSANLNEGALGIVHEVDFFSTTSETWLSGIDEQDIRYNFRDCNEIADSETDGLLAFTGNSTATVISTINTPVLVAGTWTVVEVNQMTGTTAGRLTTDSERKNVHLPVDVALGVYPDGGGTKDVTAYVYVNGSKEAASATQFETTGSKPAYVSIPWQVVFNPADPSAPTFVEVYIENNTDTTNLIVSTAKLRVN
jgi:hypothetical protein